MIQGTTPTLIFNVDVDLQSAPEISLTIRQRGQNVLLLDKSQMLVTADSISLTLDQSESVKFVPHVPIKMQIKALTADGRVISHTPPVETTVEELFDLRRFGDG